MDACGLRSPESGFVAAFCISGSAFGVGDVII